MPLTVLSVHTGDKPYTIDCFICVQEINHMPLVVLSVHIGDKPYAFGRFMIMFYLH